MKTKKIAIMGAHGTGKTSLSFAIAHAYKVNGYNSTVLTESARECPFKINEGQTEEATTWILVNQCTKELNAVAQKYDVVICDRSAYDSIIYQDKQTRITDVFGYAAYRWFATYDQIILADADKDAIVGKGDRVRSKDRNWRLDIAERFRTLATELKQDGRDVSIVKFSCLPEYKILIDDNGGVQWLG